MLQKSSTIHYTKQDLIDEDLYHELEEDLDPEDIEEIIFASFDEVQDLLTELIHAVKQEDFQNAHALAHKIKGCASSACAKQLSKTAAEFEKHNNNEPKTQHELDELINIFDQSKDFFQKILKR